VVTDRRLDVAAELARPRSLPPEDVLGSPHFLIGTVEEMADELLDRRRRWGISYWTASGSDIVPFAKVVARLTGT
jgi:hypothetical protein